MQLNAKNMKERILLIGFIAFLVWSVFSTYLYVIKIRGLSFETVALQIGEIDQRNVVKVDKVPKWRWNQEFVITNDSISGKVSNNRLSKAIEY